MRAAEAARGLTYEGGDKTEEQKTRCRPSHHRVRRRSEEIRLGPFHTCLGRSLASRDIAALEEEARQDIHRLRAIVRIDGAGNAVIATYGAAQ